jgi:hypothetical protein
MNDILRPSAQRGWRAVPSGLAAFIGIAVLVVVQQLATVGGTDLLGRTLSNTLHIPMFAVLALLLMRVLGHPSWRVLLLVCVAAGAATEALQLFTTRTASLLDLGLDLLGALPLIGAFELTRRLAVRGASRRQLAAIWVGVTLLIAVMTLAAPVRVLLAYHERDRVFPVLLVPSAGRQTLLLSSNSRIRVVPGQSDWPAYAADPVLEVVWTEERFPRIILSEVVPDWSAFATLVADVYLPEGPPITLTAAVGHDGHEGTAAYLRHTVVPGPQRLVYPLQPLLETVDGAPPRISRLVLHTSRNHSGRRLLIGSVRLMAGPAHDLPIAGTLEPSTR